MIDFLTLPPPSFITMTQPILDVRAGLSPGSLLIKSQNARSYRVAMVPPAKFPCHFQVLPLQSNGQTDGFALIRVQQRDRRVDVINQTLFEFDEKQVAEEALRELEDALIHDETEKSKIKGEQEQVLIDEKSRFPIARFILLSNLLLFIFIAIFAIGKIVKSNHSLPAKSPPQASAQSTIPALNSTANIATPVSQTPSTIEAPSTPVESTTTSSEIQETKDPAYSYQPSPGDVFVDAAKDTKGH